MERFDITIRMYRADASGTQYVWEKVPAEEGDFVLYADAQATIAALQARVQELESNRVPNSMQHVIELQAMNNRLGVRVETLESQLTQRTAELEAANKHWDALWNAACEQKDTLQAELERVRGERDKLQSEVDGWELGSRVFP